jgi:hypothetical protein
VTCVPLRMVLPLVAGDIFRRQVGVRKRTVFCEIEQRRRWAWSVGYRLDLGETEVTGVLVACTFGRGIARFHYQILDWGGW